MGIDTRLSYLISIYRQWKGEAVAAVASCGDNGKVEITENLDTRKKTACDFEYFRQETLRTMGTTCRVKGT